MDEKHVGGLSPDLLAPSTNLPPKVPGKPRGHLEVKFPYLLWDCSTPPPSPRVNVLCKWWGETSSGTIFKVPVIFNTKSNPPFNSSVVKYPVCCSWNKLKMYFEDMSHLNVIVGLGRSPNDMFVMGECVVPHLSALSPRKPFVRICSVITSGGIHLGRLKVHLNCSINLPCTAQNKLPNVSSHRKQREPASTNQFHLPGKSGGKWKKVETISSSTRSQNTESSSQSDRLVLGKRGKEMVRDLLEQARTLHDNMIREINEGGVISPVAMETDKENIADNVYRCSEWVELTPPNSPDSTCSTVDVLNDVGLIKISREEEERRKIEDEILILNPNLDPIQQQAQVSDEESRDKSHDQVQKSHDQVQKSHDHSKQITNIEMFKEQQYTTDHHTSVHSLFHILFQLDEGRNMFLPSDPDAVPNIYVICKLYCMKTPLCTGIYWRNRMPQFNIKQVIPMMVQDDRDISKQHLVLEVWHYQGRESTIDTNEDELLGFVKVSFKPISDGVCSLYNDPHVIDSVFPMTVVDSYCPVINPFTGDTNGYIKLLIIVGTPKQLPSTLGLSTSHYPLPTKIHSQPSTQFIRKEKQEKQKEKKKKHKEKNEETTGGVSVDPICTTAVATVPTTAVVSTTTAVASSATISTAAVANSATVSKGINVPDSDSIEFEICISQALHLPCLSHDKYFSSPPRAYVTCQPHLSVSKITTPISHMTRNPCWNYSCVTCIPFSFLAAANSSELEFQIWSLPYLTKQDPDVLITEADPRSHVFLGRSYIDLVTLRYGLRSLCGWYNISDVSGDIKGQLKVAVTPKGQIPDVTNRRTLTSYSPHCSSSTANVYIPYLPVVTTDIIGTECDTEVIEDTNLSLLRQQLKSQVKELEEIQMTLQRRLSSPVETIDKATSTNLTPTSGRVEARLLPSEQNQILKNEAPSHVSPPIVSLSLENSPFNETFSVHNSPSYQPSTHVSPSHQRSPLVSPSHQRSPLVTPSHQRSPLVSPSHQRSPLVSPSHQRSPLVTPSHQLSPHVSPSHQISPHISPSHQISPHVSPSHQISPHVSPSHNLLSPNKDNISSQCTKDDDLLIQNKLSVTTDHETETKQDTEALHCNVAITEPMSSNVNDVIITSSPLVPDSDTENQSDNEGFVSSSCLSFDLKENSCKNSALSDSSTSELLTNEEIPQPTKDHNLTLSDDIEEELEVQKILQKLLKQPIDAASSNSDDHQQQHHDTSSSSSSTYSIDIDINDVNAKDNDAEKLNADEIKVPPTKRKIDIENLPHFYQPEDELSDRLKQLKLSALSRYPPRPLPIDNTPPSNQSVPSNQSNSSNKKIRPYMTTPEKNRIYRVFYSTD